MIGMICYDFFSDVSLIMLIPLILQNLSSDNNG